MLTLWLLGCSAPEEAPTEELPPHVAAGTCDAPTNTLGSYYPIYTVACVVAQERLHGSFGRHASVGRFPSDLSLNLHRQPSSEVALAVWGARDRCELEYASVEVYDLGDRLHAEVELNDFEGGCIEPCAIRAECWLSWPSARTTRPPPVA